jgi:glycosyltransferase involved in cell wall biosynthesis
LTIIAANYNNGRYLVSFIKSVGQSTMLPKQLIIVDDGSTDNSREILEQYEDLSFFSPIYFNKNKGFTAALNAALDAATGKYIMRADPDDLLAPSRIERQHNFLQTHPEIDVVGCNVVYFSNDTGKKINTSNFPCTSAKIEKAFRRGEHGIQHPTAFIRGDVYRKYRYQPIFPGEDYELFARMIRDGYKFANIKDTLYLMRIHDASATTNLKYKHIKDTFHFRDMIFDEKTPEKTIRNYYRFMHNYRNYQRSHNLFKKYFHLLLAAWYHPKKALGRVLNYLFG